MVFKRTSIYSSEYALHGTEEQRKKDEIEEILRQWNSVTGIQRGDLVLPRSTSVYFSEPEVMKYVLRNWPEVDMVDGKAVVKDYSSEREYSDGFLNYISVDNLVFRREELSRFQTQIENLTQGRKHPELKNQLLEIGHRFLIRDYLLFEALELPEYKLRRLVNKWISMEPFLKDHCPEFKWSLNQIQHNKQKHRNWRKDPDVSTPSKIENISYSKISEPPVIKLISAFEVKSWDRVPEMTRKFHLKFYEENLTEDFDLDFFKRQKMKIYFASPLGTLIKSIEGNNVPRSLVCRAMANCQFEEKRFEAQFRKIHSLWMKIREDIFDETQEQEICTKFVLIVEGVTKKKLTLEPIEYSAYGKLKSGERTSYQELVGDNCTPFAALNILRSLSLRETRALITRLLDLQLSSEEKILEVAQRIASYQDVQGFNPTAIKVDDW